MGVSDVGVRLVAESEQAFVSALDNAAGAVKNLTDQAAGGFGFSDALEKSDALTTAIGIGLYEAIKSVTTAVIDMGKEAFNTIADFERTTQSIEAMLAIEIGMGQEIEEYSDAVYSLSEAEEKAALKAKVNANSKAAAVTSLLAQQDKLNKAALEDPLKANVQESADLVDKLALAQLDAAEAAGKYSDIMGKDGQKYVVTTKKQINQVDDINEAMRLAKKPAAELLDQLTRMALQSPFERTPILNVMKQGQAFGFTAKESLRATEAFIKFATVTGRNEGHITRLGYAMGQMKSQGKVMTRQLRQMNMAGMGMNQMAEAMGMSTEEFTAAVSKGKIPFDEFNENLMTLVDTKYTPAFQEINESFFGLQNALKDINKLSLAAFFEGTMKAGKGILIELVRPFTQGDALAAIQGFGDRIGEALAPGLKVAADMVGDLMQGFMDLSAMINGPTNKALTNAQDESKQAETIMKELDKALNDTAGSGMSTSRRFADLTADSAFLAKSQTNLKDEVVLAGGAVKAAKANYEDMTSLYVLQETAMKKVEKEQGKSSRKYKELAAEHEKTSKQLHELNNTYSEASGALNKLEDAQHQNTVAIKVNKAELAKLGDATKNLSPEYAKLVEQKKLLESQGRKESDTYKNIVAEITRMEEGTKTYIETSQSLSETSELAADLAEDLKKVTEEAEKAKKAAGPIPETFMGKIVASFDEFIDKSGPVAAILMSLEELFLKIKKKVTDVFDSMKEWIKGIDPKKSGLWTVNDALQGLIGKLDLIWKVGRNVVTVIVGMAFLNRIAGFASAAASALGLFLSPLGLIVGAVGLLTVEYEKGNEGVVKFVDEHKSSFDKWYANTKRMFTDGTGEAFVFRDSLNTAKNGVNRILESGFNTKLPVDMAIADMRRIDKEGFDAVREGITNVGIQFGILPSTMDKIADLVVGPIEKINGIIGGITIAYKLGVIDEIGHLWSSNPGSVQAQFATDKITEILKKVFPPSWGEGIEEAMGEIAIHVGNLRKAFDFLKTAAENAAAAIKPFTTYLVENRDTIIPVLVGVAEITAGLWLMNAALVAVTGVSLASLATGIAGAGADAGALANLQKMRSSIGLGVSQAGTPTASSLFSIDPGDMDKLAYARQNLTLASDDVKTLTGRLEDLGKLKLGPFYDEEAFRTFINVDMPGIGAATEDALVDLKKQFLLSDDAAKAALKNIDDEILVVQNALSVASTKADDFGKMVVRQEALTGGVFTRVSTKIKDSFSGVTEIFTKTSEKIGTFNTKMTGFLDNANVKSGNLHDLWGNISGRIDNAMSKATAFEFAPAPDIQKQQFFGNRGVAPKGAALLDTASTTDLLDAQARDLFVKDQKIKFAKEADDAIKQMSANTNAEIIARNKQAMADDLYNFTEIDNWKGKQFQRRSQADIAFFKAENAKYYDEMAKLEIAAFEKTLTVKKAMGGGLFDVAAAVPTSTPAPTKAVGMLDDAAMATKGFVQSGADNISLYMDNAMGKILSKGKSGITNVFSAISGGVTKGATSIWTPLAGGLDDLFLKAIPKLFTGGMSGIMVLLKGAFGGGLLATIKGGLALLTAGVTVGAGGMATAMLAPFSFVVAEFIALLGMIGSIFSFVAGVILNPFAWAAVAVAAIMWGLVYNIGGITDSIMGLLELVMIPLYMLWNGFLVLSDVVTFAMMAIWERITAVWEYAIKPVFILFNTAIAITIDWMTWLLTPFILFYSFIIKVLVPIIAVVFYGTMMGAWYVIEAVIAIVMLIVRVFFAFFQAIYSVIKIIIELINWVWETIGAGQYFRDLWKSIMDKVGGPGAKSMWKTAISWLTYFANKIQSVTDFISMLIKNFLKLGDIISYDWIGFAAASVVGGEKLEKFLAEKGNAPMFDFTIIKSPEITVDQMEDAVGTLVSDLTGDKVREPGADASMLEKLWLMATNMMKSPDAKAEAKADKALAAGNTPSEAGAAAKYAAQAEKSTAASDASRKAAMDARVATMQAPLAKGPAGAASRTPKSFMMATEGGIDPNMMGGRSRSQSFLQGGKGGSYGPNYTSQSAVSITNNNAGPAPNVSSQVGAALSAQWAAQVETRNEGVNKLTTPSGPITQTTGGPN